MTVHLSVSHTTTLTFVASFNVVYKVLALVGEVLINGERALILVQSPVDELHELNAIQVAKFSFMLSVLLSSLPVFAERYLFELYWALCME